ncbi:hypothetical protein B0H17DRAFT_1050588 [Mycena rosella]|uniref:Aminoglycoside phosphotransferase domain-containing protein n=1 Tax=Mycena rosella TaxID=1033263 RepID=A0AAD7DSL5_MYCRO|nr:hypothetical protein B0H17DRAFT_1050588 [Mycena rosella]
MIRGIRSLRQPPQDIFIGSPSRGPIQDQLWRHCGREPLGPLTTVRAFNEALHGLGTELPQFPEHELYRTFRAAFPDTASVRFTHTDLHPLNIIISSSSCEVIGIIDWQESGWYPEYWEYVKTSFNFELSGRWHDYLDVVLTDPYEAEAQALGLYTSTGIFREFLQ